MAVYFKNGFEQCEWEQQFDFGLTLRGGFWVLGDHLGQWERHVHLLHGYTHLAQIPVSVVPLADNE